MFYRPARWAAMTVFGVLGLGLTACGSSSSADQGNGDLTKNRVGAMENYTAGDQFKATEPLSFSTLFLDQAHYPEKKDWLLWSEITKRTNVTLQPTVVPNSDYDQKRSLLIGSGQAPLLIPKTYPGQETQFVASGAILPVSDYIDLMPNFKAKVAKWHMEAQLDTLRQLDGKFYILPGMHEDVWPDYTYGIRTDILKQLNLKVPATLDEFHDVLAAMKKAYPNSYPLSDEFNKPTAGGRLLATMSEAFGTEAGWSWSPQHWDPEAKKYVFPGTTDAYKQMVAYLHTLVAEGLLDPSSFTQTDDQAKQKFANSQSFVMSVNSQTLINDMRIPLAGVNPQATVAKIPNPVGPAGPVKGWTRLENGLMISAKARTSPNFVALMQFVDWLWYSDAGQEFSKWGVEGVTFTKDANGKRKLAPDVNYIGLNPKGTKKLQVDFGFMCGNFAYGGSTDLLQSMFSPEEIEYQKAMASREALPVPPPAPFNADEQEQVALMTAPLKDYVNQQTLKFILGQRDLGEWGKYVSEINAKGATKYEDLVNAAHERYLKDNPN